MYILLLIYLEINGVMKKLNEFIFEDHMLMRVFLLFMFILNYLFPFNII